MNEKRKHAIRTFGVKYSQPLAVTAEKKELFDALDKFVCFQYSCSLDNECYHQCIVQIFGDKLQLTEALYLAAKDKLLKEFKTWKNTMLSIIKVNILLLIYYYEFGSVLIAF